MKSKSWPIKTSLVYHGPFGGVNQAYEEFKKKGIGKCVVEGCEVCSIELNQKNQMKQ